jgi:hypothetical protein
MTSMHEIIDPLVLIFIIISFTLCDFILMMWKFQVFSPNVNINWIIKNRRGHSGTFNVPSWSSFSPFNIQNYLYNVKRYLIIPRTLPERFTWLGFLPKSKISGISLFLIIASSISFSFI